MAKKADRSPMGMEIKKEYLRKHLDEVGELIVRWKAELNAPRVFALEGSAGGWRSAYRPPTEEIPDNNHMLRRHLHSRAGNLLNQCSLLSVDDTLRPQGARAMPPSVR